MTLRTIIFVISAIFVAGITALFAQGWINAQSKGPAPVIEVAADPSVEVLVAATDLTAGTFVREKSLKWQPWPEDGVADGYVTRDSREVSEFVGAVARVGINVGEPVTDKRIVHPGDRGFLAAVLEPRMRAVSVPVNATSGISGFVFPGDQVDVILTVKFSESDEENNRSRTRYTSRTLLTDIRVIAIDQKIENEEGKVKPLKTVTLEVTPKQAERIAIALEMGSLSLSLQALARTEDEDVQKLLALEPKRPSITMDHEVTLLGRRAGNRKTTVNVLRGDDAGKASF